MATISMVFGLGPSQTGLALQAQMSAAGVAVGDPVTEGFYEIGDGWYEFVTAYPDDFQGAVAVSLPEGPVLVAWSVNPAEAQWPAWVRAVLRGDQVYDREAGTLTITDPDTATVLVLKAVAQTVDAISITEPQ